MDHDSKIASLAARIVEPNKPEYEDDDDEALFAELEAEIEDDSNAAMREHGLEIFRQEMEKLKAMKENEHGRYTEVTDEKEVVKITAKEPRCVVHFFHTKFKRCEIMDKHLAKLAPKYFNTRFLRVFVENIPWLVEKLAIQVLPCVICFVNGVTKDRLTGFEELGNSDAFSTAVLELRLSQCNVIRKASTGAMPLYKVASSRPDDDEVFDLDE
ncbi:thioredoxin-like protein [Mycena floridula]|nr:thioredoxin-like protein [Mycena floridula]